MSTLFPDTSSESERILVDLLRNAPPWRKIKMVMDLNRVIHDLNLYGLRKLYPTADEPEIKRHMADLLLGTVLAERVFGSIARELDDGT
jgi:hypothetical protein